MQLSEASSFRNSIMTPDQIVEKMKAGYELRNHGKGFFLFSKFIPYKCYKSIKVDDKLVYEMEKQNLIAISMPYNSLIAKLVNKQ